MVVQFEGTAVDSFTVFVRETEPRLKIALCCAFGREIGLEATADALAYGWEHWARVRAVENPAGYLWGVGRHWARRELARRKASRVRLFESVVVDGQPWIEPGLPGALGRLSERQRAAVLLVHGFEWTFAEVADLLGVSVSSVQTHVERGMARLRRRLGASNED